MSEISDMILNRSRKFLEDKDRRGEQVKDFRDGKTMENYIDNANKHGIISQLKAPSNSNENAPTYMDGVEAFAFSDEFKGFKQTKGNSKTFEWDPSSKLHLPSNGNGGTGRKTPSISTVADIRDNLTTIRSDEIQKAGVRQQRLREFPANIPQTQGDTFKMPRETGFVNSAAGRPENIDAASMTHASQSRISTDWWTVNIETIDHYVDFPEELLEDLPAWIAYMRERGVEGVDDTEDAYITNGAGHGSNEFLGYLTDPDVPTYNWSDGDVGDNMADAVLGAHVEIIAAEFMPDRNLLSVIDHAAILKLKDDNGNYLFPAAHRSGDVEFALWGVPSSKTTALSAGSGISGALRRASQYRSRKKIGFRLTDSHGDRFTAGVYTLVIARRAGFGVNRPEAVRELNFDNAPS